ncbi:hypothetical protein WJ41_35225 [Burkholderia ubonensis]|nr:hypothetical protein WJ41_35225 [Burkholderia ubonensis]
MTQHGAQFHVLRVIARFAEGPRRVLRRPQHGRPDRGIDIFLPSTMPAAIDSTASISCDFNTVYV